ncbi:hypothetical protein PMIT1323_02434 [Prochlorococcus marinus str. MIT 1323]|nr:hypothetical protein PMIT1323_02434 [Prochlorococcus marinus str. MIT 1323]
MARAKRLLPSGYSFHLTLRCNSRQFLIANRSAVGVTLRQFQTRLATSNHWIKHSRDQGLCLARRMLSSKEKKPTLFLLYVFVIIFSIDTL